MKYHTKLIYFFQDGNAGKVRVVDTFDGTKIDLPGGFKLKYRGKKTANDYWLNFSRCAAISNSTLFFVSSEDKLSAYDLITVQPLSKSSPTSNYSIQNFTITHNDILYLLTEDARVISLDYSDRSSDQLKETRIYEQTVASTMYTDIASGDDEIVVAGYREEFKSNTFVLFNGKLECMDTIEALDKSKTQIAHHIHKMQIFTRNSLSHLLAMNISCTVDLLVIHENKFHPVALNRQVSEGKEN